MMLKDILESKGEYVHTIEPEATLDKAIHELVHFNIGSLMVCKCHASGELGIVGIITERDILRAHANKHADIRHLKVCEVMSTDLVTASLDDTIEHAMRLMTKNRVRHLPLVDNGCLCGMISIGDVVKSHHDELEMENYYMRSYIRGEGAEVGTILS